jgi:hypothetical protein
MCKHPSRITIASSAFPDSTTCLFDHFGGVDPDLRFVFEDHFSYARIELEAWGARDHCLVGLNIPSKKTAASASSRVDCFSYRLGSFSPRGAKPEMGRVARGW